MSAIIRTIRLQDMEPLVEVAGADKHSVVRPSHIVERDGQIIGYISAATIPHFGVWMHTKNARPRESYEVERFCEGITRSMGSPLICMPCAVESPYHPYMTRMGFTSFGRMDMFMKAI